MIETAREGLVLRIALNRPEKRNALNLEMCRGLAEAFDRAEADESVRAVLLTGNGPSFCAGMDLKDSLESDATELAAVHERLFTLIRRVRKPVVAAVNGAALAGGAGLAANAHILVAHPEARFGLTEIRVGLWPVLIFRAMVQAIGERRAVELSLTGRTFTATEALAWGLVSEIAATPDARAAEIAAEIGEFSPNAIRTGLEFVDRTRGVEWDRAGEIGREMREGLIESEEYKTRVRAFLAKR